MRTKTKPFDMRGAELSERIRSIESPTDKEKIEILVASLCEMIEEMPEYHHTDERYKVRMRAIDAIIIGSSLRR